MKIELKEDFVRFMSFDYTQREELLIIELLKQKIENYSEMADRRNKMLRDADRTGKHGLCKKFIRGFRFEDFCVIYRISESVRAANMTEDFGGTDYFGLYTGWTYQMKHYYGSFIADILDEKFKVKRPWRSDSEVSRIIQGHVVGITKTVLLYPVVMEEKGFYSSYIDTEYVDPFIKDLNALEGELVKTWKDSPADTLNYMFGEWLKPGISFAQGERNAIVIGETKNHTRYKEMISGKPQTDKKNLFKV